eukprot:8075190-Prorocentrum_lima.AAC.1
MTSSLVGSEMCIRDRHSPLWHDKRTIELIKRGKMHVHEIARRAKDKKGCLLYTSDAADDM